MTKMMLAPAPRIEHCDVSMEGLRTVRCTHQKVGGAVAKGGLLCATSPEEQNNTRSASERAPPLFLRRRDLAYFYAS